MPTPTPTGELVIQTIAMPRDTNPRGDIFGGWLLSQMDLGAAILAKQTCQNRTATVAIESVAFKKPVSVGDRVGCYASLLKTGRTSMTINIEVWVTRRHSQDFEKAAEGRFIFVSLDENGRPKVIA